MEKVRLGRTELYVTKTAFGALPIQRISKADAVKLVRRAYEAGINYFDTANMYTDSEEKLGAALHDVRQNVIISTKSGGTDKKTVLAHIEESLPLTRTAPMLPPWRCSKKATSATSASRTTGSMWPGSPLNPALLRRSSSPSAIWPPTRTTTWWSAAARRTWASSP